MTKPTIAILLAAYNGKGYIQEQIDSILNQVDINVIVFISIDTSTDGTREFLESFYNDDSRIVILDDIGRFGGAAKNFFRLIRDVDFSSFDYVAFADQDDIWYPGKLKRAIDLLQERNVDGYSSNVLAFWEDGREKIIVKSQAQCTYDYLFEAAGPGCTYVMTQALAMQIKEKIIYEWDAVNTLWLHDWFCYAYARANGFKWVIDEKSSMRYRQHTSNQVGVNQGFNAFMHRLKKVIYGGAIEQAGIIAKLIGMQENSFVKQWSTFDRIGFLRLAFHAHACRRRLKDKFLFFLACIVLSIIGRK